MLVVQIITGIIIYLCIRKSVLKQTYKNIEIVIVEDGENISEEMIKKEFSDLNIVYEATKEKDGNLLWHDSYGGSGGEYFTTSAKTKNGFIENPCGALTGSFHVFRGGRYGGSYGCAVSYRSKNGLPTDSPDRCDYIGLRLVRTITE